MTQEIEEKVKLLIKKAEYPLEKIIKRENPLSFVYQDAVMGLQLLRELKEDLKLIQKPSTGLKQIEIKF